MIDVYVSHPWYMDHLRPVHAALGKHAGDLIQRFNKRQMTADPERPIVVCSWGDLSTVRRMGYRHVALAQHGAGQSYAASKRPDYPSYAGGRGNEGASLFLVPNAHAAGRWRAAYPATRVEIVGCPKLDGLPDRVDDGQYPVVAVSFHWNFSMCPELMSVLPEYQGALRALANRFRVIGHGHPRRHDLPAIYRRLGIEYVGSFDEILRRADVYAFDNSSSGFEFASTGRPVVVLNGRGFRREANHGLRFWDAANVGVNVNRPNDLLMGVERALENLPSDVANRERALDIVYQPRTGGARLMADVLIDWSLDRRKAVA